MGYCNSYKFCCALLCVHSSFAIILVGKRELVALLCLSARYLVIVVWLFLKIPRVCLQFVILVYPNHTHLLFLNHLVIVSTSEDHSEESVSEETKSSFFETFVKVLGKTKSD